MSDQQPTLAGFQTFITNVMQVPPLALDVNSPVVAYAFDLALDWVYKGLRVAGGGSNNSWTFYQRAVYNLAADTLISWAQDPPDSPTPTGSDGLKYWAYLRQQYGINSFQPGVLESSSDQGTSASYAVPEALKQLTIANLRNLKTPYGREYLGIIQSWGSIWGLS